MRRVPCGTQDEATDQQYAGRMHGCMQGCAEQGRRAARCWGSPAPRTAHLPGVRVVVSCSSSPHLAATSSTASFVKVSKQQLFAGEGRGESCEQNFCDFLPLKHMEETLQQKNEQGFSEAHALGVPSPKGTLLRPRFWDLTGPLQETVLLLA